MLEEIEKGLKKRQILEVEEAIWLALHASTEDLQRMADGFRRQLHGDRVWYNRNIHFEPTNICLYSCRFCAFYRSPRDRHRSDSWEWGIDELLVLLQRHPVGSLTELHITGGVHPERGVEWAEELLNSVRAVRPELHIKAFTAVEIDYFARKSQISIHDTLARLQKAGLGSLPGGGAEIFAPEVRKEIAGGKAPAHRWLEVHREAHKMGLFSNATMLYGHVENWEQRVDHLLRIRNLQEEFSGFKAFIPLRYRNGHNQMSALPEISQDEERRIFAISRLFLHNIPHLKAYWVMSGVSRALDLLSYGADDLDGTIADTTKIYSMAGGEEHPSQGAEEMESAIRSAGWEPVERDSLYRPVVKSPRSSVSPTCSSAD